MKEIKLFRTVTGQDFIGTLVEETDTQYIVEKLLVVNVNVNGDRMQVHLGPISHELIGNFGSKLANQTGQQPNAPDVPLNRGAILFVYNPSGELEKNYSQITSTIQLASRIPNRQHVVDDM